MLISDDCDRESSVPAGLLFDEEFCEGVVGDEGERKGEEDANNVLPGNWFDLYCWMSDLQYP